MIQQYTHTITKEEITRLNVEEFKGRIITIETKEDAEKAVEYLLSLGHRDLVFLGGRDSSVTHRRRHQGFLDAASAASGVRHEIFTMLSGSRIEDGYRTGLAYFSRCAEEGRPVATGLLCISDHFALGVMQAAEESGVDIPGHASLVGFDDVSFAALPRIQLTTVAQPKEEMCSSAVETLEGLIAAGGKAELQRKTIQPVLVRRNTCGPPRQQ